MEVNAATNRSSLHRMCEVVLVHNLLYIGNARNAMDAESWCTVLCMFLSSASLRAISLLQVHVASTPRTRIEISPFNTFKSATLMW